MVVSVKIEVCEVFVNNKIVCFLKQGLIFKVSDFQEKYHFMCCVKFQGVFGAYSG